MLYHNPFPAINDKTPFGSHNRNICKIYTLLYNLSCFLVSQSKSCIYTRFVSRTNTQTIFHRFYRVANKITYKFKRNLFCFNRKYFCQYFPQLPVLEILVRFFLYLEKIRHFNSWFRLGKIYYVFHLPSFF